MDRTMLWIVGLCLCVLGVTNMRGNVHTIHACNRRRVRAADMPRYAKAVGRGTFAIGVSLVIAACIERDTAAAAVILAGIAIGLAWILYGQFRYNRGLF